MKIQSMDTRKKAKSHSHTNIRLLHVVPLSQCPELQLMHFAMPSVGQALPVAPAPPLQVHCLSLSHCVSAVGVPGTFTVIPRLLQSVCCRHSPADELPQLMRKCPLPQSSHFAQCLQRLRKYPDAQSFAHMIPKTVKINSIAMYPQKSANIRFMIRHIARTARRLCCISRQAPWTACWCNMSCIKYDSNVNVIGIANTLIN